MKVITADTDTGETMRIIEARLEETARAADAVVDEATIDFRASVVDVEQAEKTNFNVPFHPSFMLRKKADAERRMEAAITASDLGWDAVERHREKQKAVAAEADTEYGELVRARRAIQELSETVAQFEMSFSCRAGEWESWHKRIGKTDEFGRVEHTGMPCGEFYAKTRRALENVEMILRGEDR